MVVVKVLRNTRELARTQIGTPYYLSPEICNGKAYNNKSDVWSLGVVLYELATLKHPFNGRNIQQLVLQITKGRYTPISTRFSRPFQMLLKSLLNANQSMRPSVNKILKQSIMQKRISVRSDVDMGASEALPANGATLSHRPASVVVSKLTSRASPCLLSSQTTFRAPGLPGRDAAKR